MTSDKRQLWLLIGQAAYLERLAEIRCQPDLAARHYAIRLSLLNLAVKQAATDE
jgi:hypothetical protein